MLYNNSLEEMIDEIFSEKDTSFEDEEIKNIIDQLPDDKIELAEESAQLQSEINMLNFGLQVSEEYLWSRSEESTSDVWGKFVEWLKAVIAKIKETAAVLVKRIHIFLAGDMKKVINWANANSKELDNLFTDATKDISFKMLYPKDDFINLQNSYKKRLSTLTDLCIMNTRLVKNFSYDKEIHESTNDFINETNVDKFKEHFFGSDAKAKSITIKEFNNKILPIKSAISKDFVESSRNEVKDMYIVMKTIGDINYNKLTLLGQKKQNEKSKGNLKLVKSKEDRNNLKKLIQSNISLSNKIINMTYYMVSLRVKMIQTAYRFAKAAVNANTKS